MKDWAGSTHWHTFLGQSGGALSEKGTGGALFHFFGSEASKVQKVTLEDSRSQPPGWDSIPPRGHRSAQECRVNERSVEGIRGQNSPGPLSVEVNSSERFQLAAPTTATQTYSSYGSHRFGAAAALTRRRRSSWGKLWIIFCPNCLRETNCFN